MGVSHEPELSSILRELLELNRTNRAPMRLSNVAMLTLVFSDTAMAEIILDVQDLSFHAGVSGSVDVNIRRTASDAVDFYQYRFVVTDIGTNVGTLRFRDPQSDDENTDPNYLFGLDSPGVTTVTENSPAFDSVVGTDLTLTGFGVAVDTSNLLFARLEFEHILPGGVEPSLAGNDQFLISLVEADTVLLSDSFDVSSFVSFTGSSGTLSAVSAAVPEPSSVLLLCACSTAGFICYRRQKRIS